MAPTGVLTNEYIKANTMMISKLGILVKLMVDTTSTTDEPDQTAWNRHLSEYNVERAVDMAQFMRRTSVTLIHFTQTSEAGRLAAELHRLGDIMAMGVMVIPGQGNIHSEIFRRNGYLLLPEEEAFGITEVIVPRLAGRQTASQTDQSYRFIEAWVKMQTTITANFTAVHSDVYDGDVIIDEWKNHEPVEVLNDILACKNVPKRKRDAREQYVADNATMLERMWKAGKETQTRKYMMTNDPSIPRIQELVPFPRTYVFTHVDPEDGCRVKTFSGVASSGSGTSS